MLQAYSLARDGGRRLSANFRLREFACRDGSDPVFIDTRLVQVLQSIRDHFGKPVTVTSGSSSSSREEISACTLGVAVAVKAATVGRWGRERMNLGISR